MYYLDNKSGVVIMPPPQDTQSDTPLWFSEDKDAPSYPGADWFNIVTLELINILKLGGGGRLISSSSTSLHQSSVSFYPHLL